MTRRKSPNVYYKPRKSRSVRNDRRRKSPLRRVVETLSILICVLLVVGGGLWYYIAYAPAIPEETVLYVPSKASYSQV